MIIIEPLSLDILKTESLEQQYILRVKTFKALMNIFAHQKIASIQNYCQENQPAEVDNEKVQTL